MQQSMDFGKRILKRSQELRRVQECLRVDMIALTSRALRLNMITTPGPLAPPRLNMIALNMIPGSRKHDRETERQTDGQQHNAKQTTKQHRARAGAGWTMRPTGSNNY